jgi:glycogen operon protein
MINASAKDMTFEIQQGNARAWRRVVDTGLPSPEDISEPGLEPQIDSLEYLVQARSTVLLMRDY